MPKPPHAMPCHAMPCYALSCRALVRHKIHFHVILWYSVPFHFVLRYYPMLCFAVLCHAMLTHLDEREMNSFPSPKNTKAEPMQSSNLELGRYIYLNDNPNIFPRNLIECGFRAFSNIGSSRCTAMAYYTLEKESIYCLMTRD